MEPGARPASGSAATEPTISDQPSVDVDAVARATFRDAAVPAALIRLGDGGTPAFADVNVAFSKLLGCDPEAAVELPVAAVFDDLGDVIAAVASGSGAAAVVRDVAISGVNAPALVHVTMLDTCEHVRLVMVQVTDVARDGQVERALRESEKRVQDLVDNVRALIYIKAADDGAFLLVNRHFEEMFGVSRVDAPFRTNYDFFPKKIAEVYSANDRRVLETGVAMEFEEPRAEGGRWLSLKFPLFDVDGEIYAVGGISTDISSRSRAAAMILQAKDEAERANQAKSEFLSRMSHELRTPLNSILGFGQLLQMKRLPAGTRESVDRIVKAGRHLLTLINGVLEISRIEAQTQPSGLEPLDLCRPLTEAVELVRPLANERDIEIVQDLHGGLYRYVLADEQRLTQVLLNILSNAIKYNRIGGQVKVFFRDGDNHRLRVCVTDTGYGISSDAMAKIFLPFERLGADRTATEGTGLGLTLSRSLIEAMNGTIGIERSLKDMGTTFYVELPLVPSSEVVAPRPLLRDAEPIESLAIEAGTVLYIEDNLANLELVNELFHQVGKVRLIPAVQGQLGIELAARHRPDLILLDLHLPDLDGDEVLSRLREDPRTAQIPVIVLSADATGDQVARLKASGAAEYVTKPIDVSVFLRAVQGILAPAAAQSDNVEP
jgi:PAS domain S-box-containing protein